MRSTTLNASSSRRAVVIFARSPVAGQSKTRLIPSLGAKGAACFQRALCLDTLTKVARLRGRFALYIATTGPGFCADPKLRQHLSSFTLLRQHGADLGERLENVFRLLLRQHSFLVVIGTDSPELAPSDLVQAFDRLRSYHAVLGPCPDGGYYLLGLRRGLNDGNLKDLFRGVRWGTRWALHDSLKNVTRPGLASSLLEPCADVDKPGDLVKLFRRMSRSAVIRRLAPNAWHFLQQGL